MKIEYLRLKNLKAFRDVEMKDIPRFCVLVGANGTGKSTLFHMFSFLKDALSSNVHAALVKFGVCAWGRPFTSLHLGAIPQSYEANGTIPKNWVVIATFRFNGHLLPTKRPKP